MATKKLSPDQATLAEIAKECEDGLDPSDALTAEEALARVLCHVRGFAPYEPEPRLAGRMPCIVLMDWERHPEHRPMMEAVGLIARWVVG